MAGVAALVGRAFEVPIVGAACALTEDGAALAIDELWRRHLVRHHGGDLYDFSHDRLREVLLDDLGEAVRRTVHRRLAVALAARGRAEDAARIANHLDRAGRPDAAEWFGRAACHAARVFAHAEALAFIDRALAISGGSAVGDGNGALLELRADVLVVVGRTTEATTAYRAAAASDEASLATRARRTRKAAAATIARHDHAEAASLLAAASALTDGAPPGSELAREGLGVDLVRLDLLYWSGASGELTRRTAALQDHVEAFGSLEQRARFWLGRLNARNRQQRYVADQTSLEYARCGERVARESGDPMLLGEATFMRGFTWLWARAWDRARGSLREALAISRRTSFKWLELRAETYLAVVERLAGDVEACAAANVHAAALAAELGLVTYQGTASANDAWIALCRVTPDRADALARSACGLWSRSTLAYPFQWTARLVILACRDDPTDASAHARVLLDDTQQTLPVDVEEALKCVVSCGDASGADARSAREACVAAARRAGLL